MENVYPTNYQEFEKPEIPDLWYLIFGILLMVFSSFKSAAQDLNFNTTVPYGFTVCESSESFGVEFTNISNASLEDIELEIQLPLGLSYLNASLVESSSFNVQALDVSNSEALRFVMDDLGVGETVSFSFQATAGFESYQQQIGGNIFNNQLIVNYNDGSTETTTTNSYNILYPAISIIQVDPMANSVFVGESFTRSVTIVNGGYGSISSFVLRDEFNDDFELLSVDKGNLSGNEVTFTAADFTSIGNGDGLFDLNETIVLTQTLKAISCNNVQDKLIAFWGCDGETVASNSKYPNTTVQLFAPNLSVVAVPSVATCLQNVAAAQQLEITNTGIGPANEIVVEIFPNKQNQYTRIDPASISYSLNGTGASLTPINTQVATGYACLGDNPLDGFTVELPSIAPGETLNLTWDNYTCPTTACGNVHYLGWSYEGSYSDMCDKNTYGFSGLGQDNLKKNMPTFYESPSDLVDGQVGTYTLNINSATFVLPEEDGAYFEAVFDIPLGLNWSGESDDLRFENGSVSWNASQIDYNTTTRTLKARYELPIPNNFSLNHAHFDLDLTADCSANTSWVVVGMQLLYIMDPACSNIYRIAMTCYETAQTQLHCPGPCNEGMQFSSFDVLRTSYGQPDNDLNGLADASGSLDFTKVKRNRVMVSDTFETVFTGRVKTSSTFPSWAHGYARSEIPYGNEIAILDAQVEVTDQSTGQVLTAFIPYSESVTAGVRNVDFDFSPSTLVANGYPAFANFVLEGQDEVVLSARYKVVDNIGGNAEQVMIQNEFYLSDVANGTAYQCNDWNGNFTIIGYFYRVNSSEQYNVKSCTKTISQNYKMSIGDCCTNYAGGNLFPYEYRNWSAVNTLRVEIPDGYTFVSAYMNQWRTKHTSASVKETTAIVPTSISGTSHVFDLEQYYSSNGGNLNLSDDGFHGKVYIELKPDCNVNEAANLPVYWYFDFKENAVMGGNVTEEYSNSPDYIKYYRAKLDISSQLPTQEGLSSLVDWEISVKSKNAAATNAWLYFKDETGEIVVEELVDIATGQSISPINGFYHIQDLTQNQTRKFKVTASYNDCDLSTLTAHAGYDCEAYPTQFETLSCGYESYELYIIPQDAELQIKFNSYTNPLDECDNSLTVELELLSSKLASVNDLFVQILPPSAQTVTLESGSLEVLYPLSGSYTTLADPALLSNVYTITGADIDDEIGTNGLVGVTNVSANRLKLKMNLLLDNNYQPGEIINFSIGGNRPCGTAITPLAVAFDPNASFESPENIGLDEISDAWASAWADYDNDGLVDLFVTNYADSEANYLYKNLGNGSFSKVTTGAIATDKASSLAATWGDYNNDGHIDLFVSNNIGYENFLYRNNGDGSFTRVLNDPIVIDKGYAHGASWVDYDRDGYLDLFVADYFSTHFNKLYHNNGDGTFSLAANAAPSVEASSSVSAAWGDYNNDGYPDLFVANTNNENNSLYQNQGNGSFVKINTGVLVTDGGSSVGASWADYDNDGDLDLFVANSGNQNNFLYQNNGDASFTKITTGVIVTDGGHSHGSAWADYDNDGDLDLYVGNDQDQNNFLYSNNGDGSFNRVTNDITQDRGDSFGAAWADYDNDGDVDLFVANHNLNKNFIYKNTRGKCQNKACVTLVGTSSNRSAIGTKLFLKANIYGEDVWQMREIVAQSGGGVGGQNELKTIFGLGNATIADSIIIEWNSGYRQILTDRAFNDCLTITEENASEICGVIYYDENENCLQDNGEMGIPNRKLLIQPGNRFVITEADGSYSFLAEPNVYTIEQVTEGTNWEASCTEELTVNVDKIGTQFCGNNFSSRATCALPDLRVEISTTAHRIGFENVIAVTYKNVGAQTASNVHLTVMFGDKIIPLESSIPWDLSIAGDRRWNLGELTMGTEQTIYIKDSIAATVPVGEELLLRATIYADEDDCFGADNVIENRQAAVGAFDPNDIAVSPEGYIDVDQELKYKIRFQNVGNSPVATVRIEDRLPEHLDIATLELGAASHSYRFEIVDGNRLVWTFENINMPDSLTNEPESHGFVHFKIYPRASLEDQTEIPNSALIFFDNMVPIETNMVVNIIGEAPVSDAVSNQLNISPNPMIINSKIRIKSLDGLGVKMNSLTIYDLLGKKIKEYDLEEETFELQKGNLLTGCYFLKAIGEDGKEYSGKIIIK